MQALVNNLPKVIFIIAAAAVSFFGGSLVTDVHAEDNLDTVLDSTRSAEEILACVQANLPQKSSTQTLKFAATDRAKSVRELQAHSWWQRSSAEKARVNMRLIGPPDLADSSYLIAQSGSSTGLFTYIPSLDKVQRISGQSAAQQLWGTDFSYDDMRFVQGSAYDGEFTRLADDAVQDRPVYVLAQQPGDDSVYTLIVSYIEPTTCISLQTDFFISTDTNGSSPTDINLSTQPPRKRLQTDFLSIREVSQANHANDNNSRDDAVNKRWVASEMRIDDLQEQTHTVLVVEAIEFDPKLSSSLFNPRSFYRAKAP